MTTAPNNSTNHKTSAPRRRIFTSTQTDWVFRHFTLVVACIAVVVIILIGIMLGWVSRPSFHHSGLSFYTSTQWDPVAAGEDKKLGDLYGAIPFLYGTLLTSLVALIIAVPLGIGSAIFLSEVAPRWLSTPISFVVELLAAVPSIVYGFWAFNYLIPPLQLSVGVWFTKNFGQIPFFAATPDVSTGTHFFAAGIILAMMILPFITAVSRDVLRTVPLTQREAAYGMGATRWEAIKSVVLRYASSGIIGAVMLGLGRAIGETMAVTMVIGSKISFPTLGNGASFSLFRSGYTMTALLADQYPSPNSDLHKAALTQIGLTLFFVTIGINALARGLVWLTAMKPGSGNAWIGKIKDGIGQGGRWASVGVLILFFALQFMSDFTHKGGAALFGAAEIIGYILIGLALFNRYAPGKPFFVRWRKVSSLFAVSVSGLCAFIACFALFMLLYFVGKEGISAINADFFKMPDAGGIRHAIAGTGLLVFWASLFGIPVGIIGGIYLAEFGNNRFGGMVRFATDLLNGVPSIVIGIFAYALIIVPTEGRAGIANAGAFGLGIMMIPTVMRTTEELIRLVPVSLREGSLALGATYTYTLWKVVLPSARAGIMTGILLAVARVAGETAPLLMVGCNSTMWSTDMKAPIASLPMLIYTLRDQPETYHQLWGAAFLLVMLVLVFNVLARIATRSRFKTS
ncbi:MAG: phosphate ABC transporter permease subunit PstC [Armatimonadetes bacterium]|nr:phosphate ABC transporter permease subunit PstC [Armatimonadota bacterium]